MNLKRMNDDLYMYKDWTKKRKEKKNQTVFGERRLFNSEPLEELTEPDNLEDSNAVLPERSFNAISAPCWINQATISIFFKKDAKWRGRVAI